MNITSEVFRLVGIYRHDGDIDAFNAALDELYAPPPELTCDWCGATESETDDYTKGFEWWGLTDITIRVAEGEEGDSYVRKYVCSKDFNKIIDALRDLGFVQHRHGGICFLEADPDEFECGGYGKCPIQKAADDY